MTPKLTKLQLEAELEKAHKRIIALESLGNDVDVAGNKFKSSEVQFRLLADNMSDIVWLMDTELQVFYISPSTEKIQGYTLEELRVMGLKEQLTPESYERAMALYTEGLSPSNISQPNPKMEFDIDLEFYKKDGSTYWSSNTFKFILNEDGQPIMILGVGRDITKKKLAEDELRDSEERYRNIAEDMPVMICRFKADGTLTFVNSFYCNYFNSSYEELIGSSFLLLVPEPERAFVQNKHLSLNLKNPFVTYEHKIINSDGGEIWQRWTNRALFNDQGEVVEYQAIGEDITESKQTEQQLTESESRFRALIANMGDLIVVIDAQGIITFASPSSERIFGYKPEEAVGKNFLEWMHPEDVTEAIIALESRNKIPGTAPQSILARGRHKDGSWRYVETLGTNLLNNPAIRGIVLNIHDVTEQHRIELEKQVIYEIMQGAAFSHHLEEFLGLVHYSISRVLRADNFFVSLHNLSSGFFEDVYYVDQFDEALEPSSREGTLTSYIFRTGNPLLATEEKFKELIAAEEVELIGVDSKSWIGVPLKTAGKTIGVMVIQDYETADLYSERDLAFLASISGQVASAVERKQAEERLHESEEKYRFLIENASEALYVIQHGLVVFANPMFEKISQVPASELIGMDILNFVPSQKDRMRALRNQKLLLRGKVKKTQGEYKIRLRSGEELWVNVSEVITNWNGELAVLTFTTDISERKEAEEALRRAEEKYRTIFENSLEGIFQSTPAGRFITVNPALARMWGYDSPEDLLASVTNIANQVYSTPTVRAEHIRLLKEHGGNLIGFEYQARCKDGSVIWVSESVHSIFDVDGTLLYFEGAVENISSRKQAEETLRESEARLNHAQAVAHTGSWEMDLRRNILTWSAETYRIFNILPETPLTYEAFLAHIHPDDMDSVNGAWQAALQGEPYDVEHRILAGEAVKWVRERAEMETDSAGNALRGIGTMQDITERKQAEEDLRNREATLQAVLQSTADGILAVNPENKVLYANERFAEMWMIPHSILSSKDDSILLQYILDQIIDPEEFSRKVQELYQSDKDSLDTLHFKDGRVFERLSHPMLAGTNGIGRVWSFRDITERRQAEVKLNESELRYRSLFESSPIPLWEEDFSEVKKHLDSLKQQGVTDFRAYFLEHPEMTAELNKRIKVLSVNQATLKMYHAKDMESLLEYVQEPGKGELDHNHEDFIAIAEGRTSNSWDGADQTATGEALEISFRWAIVPGYENDYSNIIITTYDITESKLANDKIIESEKRYRSLFEDSPISLWEDDYSEVKHKLDELRRSGVTDFEAYFAKHPEKITEYTSLIKVIDSNQYSIKLFGAKNKAHLLENSYKLLATEFINNHELVNIANGKLRFEWEGTNRKLTGELINIKLTWAVAPGYENDLSKVIISIIDISKIKQAEEDIHRQLSELETLYESGLAISRLLSPKAIAQKVIEILDRRMNWHHIAIRQYEPETNSVKLLAFNRPDVSADEEAEQFIAKMNKIISTPNQGLSGWATLNGISIRVPDVKNDPRYIAVFPEIQSGVYVPIKIGERVTGSISVESDKEDAFTENDERLLETLAVQAAIAIENATLFLTIQKEIMERQQAEATLKIQAEELLQLNDKLEQRVQERTAEIEVTRKRLELATDAAGLGIWEWEIATGKVKWDSQMYRIYGISPEEFDGKIETQLKFIHPEHQNILMKEALKIIENKETSFKIEHSIIRRDNKSRQLLEQAVAILDQTGLLESIIGIVDDITPQKKAEQDLRESESYARKLFDASPDPIFVSDTDGIMIDINRLFEQQHRIRHEEAQGRHISELNIFPAKQLAKFNTYMMDILSGKNVSPVELIFNHPDGAMHTLEMNSYPIEVKSAQLILSATRDITIHKKAEESLRVANAEMERALRIKTEFLANMSHELRTPLNAVLGMAESLEEQIAGPLNDKQLKYIRTISESGKHLLELINDILDLSKIEAGRLELNVSQISVASLCEASMRMVKEQALKKNQMVSLKIDPEVKHIVGDERRLKQVLVNLLSNAVKFTPNDQQVGVEVKGNIRNQTVTFTVWDEGIGIDPEELKLIFKPFIQLDAGLAREFSGTGLGLVLVAQMIRLHGGSVSVESKQGQGSRFSITLPWVDVEGVASAKNQPQKTEPVTGVAGKRNERILIVEDTDSIIMLLSEYLRYRGYQILVARNGAEGVKLAREEKPDLILMDVMMPVMNGVEATEKIRAEKDLLDIPIIALTALAMAGDRERCLKAGMNDYLSKPVQMKELENLILKHLNLSNKKNAPPT